MEVTFVAALTKLYEQAGLVLRVSDDTWIKAGLEYTDGAAHLSTVVTRSVPDWSTAAVAEWSRREVTVRASRAGDAVTIRARLEADPWVMTRLAPMEPDVPVLAGPYSCSPQSAGFEATFLQVVEGPADAGLHEPPP